MRVIDGHVHVWDLRRRAQPWLDPAPMTVIRRDHPPEELEAELTRAGVDGAILVQVLNQDDETDDYLHYAAASDLIVGVVGWVDLLVPDLADRLDRVSNVPGAAFLGVRHQAQAEADPDAWLRRLAQGPAPRVLTERALPCDLMLRPAELTAAYDVVRRCDGVAFVLNHAGKPPVASGWEAPESQEWARLTARLAEVPHIAVKLSGLTTMADVRWTVDDLRPFVDHLLAHFGPRRLIFGSDWPVSRRAGEYQATLAATRELLAGLSEGERAAILGTNAERLYRFGAVAAR